MNSQFEPVPRLPNMQDSGPAELAARDSVTARLREIFRLRGYDRAETPFLEQTELYLRKSGGALSSRLYGFVEPGGYEVSLRPEFTSAIVRYALDLDRPGKSIRLMYDGPVFRYAGPDEEDGDKTRQFTQLGAELIGPPAPSADGEIIAMALEGLRESGIASARVVVGHVGVVLAALAEYQLSERARLFLVKRIEELKRGQVEEVSQQAATLGFLSDATTLGTPESADRERLAATIRQVMAAGIGVQLGQNTGSRTPEEIIDRLSRKMSQVDSPEEFRRALDMLTLLSNVSGSVESAVGAARNVLSKSGISVELVSNLTDVLSAAEIEGVKPGRMSVDFGRARGIAYYTGMLFDIYADDASEQTLGGGGRYDGLTRALGYDRDVPALGFAYNLDAVTALLARGGDGISHLELISPSDSGSVRAAVESARELRAQGKRAAVNFEDPASSKRTRAKGKGAK
ncbi:MAG: ATP phosphoribosyltransferase regulatory subunit [Chloroflexi bacterium]|nr:ATP phosphoribosyltransferase regulatory subunit [Chloroflexota bacterium]